MNDSVYVANAYRAGRVTFMGLSLHVAPGALVPRSETELLVMVAIRLLSAHAKQPVQVIDLCCGVGNVSCAIAHALPAAKIWAIDIEAKCAELARSNAVKCGVADRVSVLEGDLLTSLADAGLEGGVDAIVCNPPYISEHRLAGQAAHLLEQEPRSAFAAGPYGLSVHARLARDASHYLSAGGHLCMEIGLGQGRQVYRLLERTGAYDEIQLVPNADGEERVIAARRCGP
jgi:release factor glutamine methyltransferase